MVDLSQQEIYITVSEYVFLKYKVVDKNETLLLIKLTEYTELLVNRNSKTTIENKLNEHISDNLLFLLSTSISKIESVTVKQEMKDLLHSSFSVLKIGVLENENDKFTLFTANY